VTERPDPVAAPRPERDIEYSIQWRCPRISRHDIDNLPKPCPDCYSVVVTSRRIPYRESVRWQKEPISDV